uniref:separase n=1 Tax=Fragaria vesca subsp. vesca TaxID=101020 RepID=UPI0005CAD98D|nr:PREDICTED: separase [Fragaria vesca subsp. vesca]
MASAAETSESLLSKLESADSAGIHRLISDYLNPFADLHNKKKKKTSADLQTLQRSLAKKFTPFLNRALSILPKRLADPSNLDAAFAPELFDIYRLCLDSMAAVSSQFSGKPYKFHIHRIRFICALEAWARHRDAESEALRVLKSFKAIQLGTEPVDLDSRFVPGVKQGCADNEFGALIGEVVYILARCASAIQSKEEEVYERLLCMVEELAPWFRVLDETASDKVHRQLAIYLGRCTLFLVETLSSFGENLICKFCCITVSEYAKSPIKDHMFKWGRRICSALFSLQEPGSSRISNTLLCLLDSLVDECKAEIEFPGKDFAELTAYCANKCCTTSTNLSGSLRSHLEKLITHFDQVPPLNLILRLYATGLHYVDCSLKSKDDDVTSSGGAIRMLLDDGGITTDLSDCLDSLESYFQIGTNDISKMGFSTRHVQKNLKDYLLPYYNALEFLCHPLVDIVYSGKKQIFADNGAAFVSNGLWVIQGAFHQLYDVFLSLQTYRITCDIDIDGFKQNSILRASVAACILSTRTKLNTQRSAQILNHVITSEWIQLDGLKHIYASLYSTGTRLYKNKELTEASEALKLSCKASWARVIRLCELFAGKLKVSIADLSKDTILDVLNESCTVSAFLLDILNQVDNHEVKRAMVECLETWSTAVNLFGKLPGPMSVVKQWVKMECKCCNNVHIEDSCPTLYSLLSSSKNLSKKTTEIILEQGLLAYEQMYAVNPEFCQKMQMQIINILLQDVYVTPDSWLQKAKILVRKGRWLKLYGINGLKDCICCLTEAITLLVSNQSKTYGNTSIHETSPRHELAVAYCLRALCTQEDEPQSEKMFQDIRAALDAWLGISTIDMCSPDDKCFMVSESTMTLLYNIFDLLSIKVRLSTFNGALGLGSTERIYMFGHMDYYHDIYRILIRLYNWKNIPLEKCLVRLWECRRVSHALCSSPVNDTLVMNLSDHFGELPKSIEFWVDSLKGSRQLVIGFQHNFSFLFANVPGRPCIPKNLFRCEITVDEVKEAALELISSVPVSSQSSYVTAYLYYDLCERLVSNGQLVEALSYAMEAHQLRRELFQKKFAYCFVQKTEKYNETGDTYQKFTLNDHNLVLQRSVSREVWSFDTSSCNLEKCYLSPYNVLQCYLESTLQVGVIHEIIGNGAEAEVHLQWGKTISCSQSLPLFTVAFCSVLGKLYLKKQLWDLAEKELQSAKQYLDASEKDISCLKCRLMQEATVELNLADLYQRKLYSSRSASLEKPSCAESLYNSALTKLNLPEWKNSVSCPGLTVLKEVGNSGGSTSSHFAETKVEPKGKIEAKKSRTKNARKPVGRDQVSVPYNLRSTQSRSQSCHNQSVRGTGVQVGDSKNSKRSTECDSSDNLSNRDFLLDLECCEVSYGCDQTCICHKTRCWQCLPMEVMESGLLKNFVDLKWEYVRRRLSLRLLTGLGNCLEHQGQIHEANEFILQSVSVLVSRNPFSMTTSSVPPTCLLDLMAKEIPGDVLSVERAEILYSICWLSLKIRSKNKRVLFSDLPHIHLPKLVSWLMLAFVLCREVPVLFQKVSRLLAAIFLLSASSETFSLSSSCKNLHENHWASYFHQASIGAHLNYHFFTKISERCKLQHPVNSEGAHVAGSCLVPEKQNLHRVAPESTQYLEEFVTEFFSGLPCTTIICISVLGGPYASLLQELLCFPSLVHAWIVVSRLNSKNQPISVLLPVDSVLEGDSDDDSFSGIKNWHCPWGSTVVDDVAPEFRLILEGTYSSSVKHPVQDTNEKKLYWWVQRKNFDRRLGEFLKNLEDSWFGAWKLMLLGEWSDREQLDSVLEDLVCSLKSKCKMEIDESVLKVILGGSKYDFEGGPFVTQLCRKKGSYINKFGCLEEEKCMASCNDSSGGDNLSESAYKLVSEAVNELKGLHSCVNIEPTILVLDYEVQMLPWENLPVLRNQEVYRMPSVGSILATANRNYQNQDQVQSIATLFPLIDPLDAFYLLNPSGDLNYTQNEFETWFRDQNLEGKAGSAPPAEELAVALSSHDLFLYFGHGCGKQYIPRHEIQKLEHCAATLLMGCSSGSLKLNGCYVPQGTPLSYLLAGSPVIVANLWDVTDRDIDRFAKSMLDSWLKARSSPCVGCVQKSDKNLSCEHRPTVGSFMSEARKTCQLPFLIGAAPVCYGVPTGIWKKEL